MRSIQSAAMVGLDSGDVVDVPSAEELLVEIHCRASRAELDALMRDVARKAARFGELLAPARVEALTDDELRALLRSTFVARRRVSAVLGIRPEGELAGRIGELLYGDDPLTERFDAFCAQIDGLPEQGASELAAELLHFSAPHEHAPWTRWMYSVQTRTGALPLVISEDIELESDTPGATYARVGEAVRMLDSSAEVASFRSAEVPGPLATDVFLVGAYGVYMATVLGLKMSDEFNSVVPRLPELGRRLLGVHRMEV